MKKHPTKIDGYDTLEDAAIAVGKLRYDKLSEFLSHLTKEMERQQSNDYDNGKVLLSQDVGALIDSIDTAGFYASELFNLYKKFMKDELD